MSLITPCMTGRMTGLIALGGSQRSRAHAATPRAQRGAALLMAMVIVTLVATLAASMVWQQWRAVQVESSERLRTQASWVLNGALDWARLILREDARGTQVDDLTEVWAQPLAEARLSSFLAADSDHNAADEEDTIEAFLSGKVDDAQGKFNLTNLVEADGEINKQALTAFQHLCEYVSLSPALAKGVADAIRTAKLGTLLMDAATMEKLGGEQARAQAPLMPQSVDQLLWIGLDAGTMERLRPYVTVLPDKTAVNVNTASKEVIAAVTDTDLGRAARLIQIRQRTPFKDLSEVTTALALRPVPGSTQPPTLDPSVVDIKSNFFEVSGRQRIEDNIIEERHLLQRAGGDVVVRYQSRFSGVDRQRTAAGTP